MNQRGRTTCSLGGPTQRVNDSGEAVLRRYRAPGMSALRVNALAALLCSAAALGAVAPAAAAGDGVAVARTHILVPGGSEAAGAVFFVPAHDEAGAVAVGAAHSFDRNRLAEAGEVEFRRAADGGRVGIASRYFVEPGRAFHEDGATLRDDFIVFALELRPRDIEVLEPASRAPQKGERVRILGIPSDGRKAQAEIEGSVASVLPTRIEVDLDAPEDLRGWGGSPVLDAEGRVLGLLQAAWTLKDTLRVGVGPIDAVVQALKKPLDGGLGRRFASYSTAPSPAPDPARAPRAHATADAGADAGAGAAAAPPRPAASAPAGRLRVRIEHPEPESVIGDAAGAFIAGRAVALSGDVKRFDVVIVLDTSGSTAEPTGVDVDGNGVVGTPRLGALGGLLALGSTDPGDSILAAEVAAAQRLLSGLDPRSTRVAVVTFAGEPTDAQPGFFGHSPAIRQAAITMEPLTSDYERVKRALDRVRQRGPRGMTHMAAGVDQATVELLGLSGAVSKSDPGSDKVMLFFTDGEPTLPYQGFESDNVRAVLRAAQRAQRAGIRIHSFAIGPAALAGPISTVEMASITDGEFTPVRHPGLLVHVVSGVSFANIQGIEVHNETTGEDAYEVRSHADGSWDSLVPLTPGKNLIRVLARASDGSEAAESVVLHYAPGVEGPFLPRELVTKRNELLEARLVEIRRGRIEVERKAAEQTRRELALEIERERAQAAERAERQRKELDLRIDDADKDRD